MFKMYNRAQIIITKLYTIIILDLYKLALDNICNFDYNKAICRLAIANIMFSAGIYFLLCCMLVSFG